MMILANVRRGRVIPCRKQRQKGAELAEFAMVFPLFLALIFALIWGGRALSVYGTITRAAREGARFAVAPSCASCLPANTSPTDTEVANVVNSSLQAASLSPASIQSYTPPGGTTFCSSAPVTGCKSVGNINVCRGVQFNSGATPLACGVLVSFAYQVPFGLNVQTAGALIKLPQITVTTSVQASQEQ